MLPSLANLTPPSLTLFIQLNHSCQLKNFIDPHLLENLVLLLIFKCIRYFLMTTNYVSISFANITLFRTLFVKIIFFHSFQRTVSLNGFD